MKFVCCHDWDQLSETDEALFAQAQQHSLFYSKIWLQQVAATLEQQQCLLLLGVKSEQKLLALLPLVKAATSADSAQYAFALKHRYSTHYSVLLAQQARDQNAILHCLAQGLQAMGIRSLLLEPVLDDDSHMVALQEALNAEGYRCDSVFRGYNWIYRSNGQAFSEYLAERPARLRNTITRKQRKLRSEHGYTIKRYVGNEVPGVMPDYYTVYSASWKADEQYREFLDAVVAACSAAGWTRLAVMYVKDKPIAAQLWFVLHGKANIFRLAYDQAWQGYSPGSILTQYMMQYAIDVDRVQEIDFLIGNERYKQDWMGQRRKHVAVSCVSTVAPRRQSGVLNALRRLGRSLMPGSSGPTKQD